MRCHTCAQAASGNLRRVRAPASRGLHGRRSVRGPGTAYVGSGSLRCTRARGGATGGVAAAARPQRPGGGRSRSDSLQAAGARETETRRPGEIAGEPAGAAAARADGARRPTGRRADKCGAPVRK